jgi:hypothetical protein
MNRKGAEPVSIEIPGGETIPQQTDFYRLPARFGAIPLDEAPLGYEVEIRRRARLRQAGKPDLPAVAASAEAGGTYERVWFDEAVGPEEVAFEAGVFLLLKNMARLLKEGKVPARGLAGGPELPPTKKPEEEKEEPEKPTEEEPGGEGEEAKTRTIQVKGRITPETWNRLGTKLLPKLRAAVPAACLSADRAGRKRTCG